MCRENVNVAEAYAPVCNCVSISFQPHTHTRFSSDIVVNQENKIGVQYVQGEQMMFQSVDLGIKQNAYMYADSLCLGKLLKEKGSY